jgi:hypothetical protein
LAEVINIPQSLHDLHGLQNNSVVLRRECR